MTTSERRTIRRSKLTSNTEALSLVQSLLLGELLRPSVCMWIVSPWISDIPILDNSTLNYSDLSEDWGPRQVRLSEVLVQRARSGAQLVIATRLDDDRNKAFVSSVRSGFYDIGADDPARLLLVQDDLLHEKGLAGDDYYLSGSMNLTWTGVHISSEMLRLSLALDEVQAARRSFSERYGGEFRLRPTR